ncbi:MAG: hypothetical protein HGB12_02250 [Bacteroidetes bacterium]|nr:hypothetical protein [Bacteroidota bacterium]
MRVECVKDGDSKFRYMQKNKNEYKWYRNFGAGTRIYPAGKRAGKKPSAAEKL